MCAAVVVGTWLGSLFLERVNERAFTILFKTVLTLVALHAVFLGGQRFHVPEIPIYALLPSRGLLLLTRVPRAMMRTSAGGDP